MLERAALMGFIACRDLERAKQFYFDVLGLPVQHADERVLVLQAAGTVIRVSRAEQPVIAPYTVLGWRVDDIAATVDELQRRGVSFQRYAGFPQDERGIMTFPNGDRVAWFMDPDGNVLSVTSFAA